MRARRLWFGLLGNLALVMLPASAGAQAVRSEYQVNTSARAPRHRHVAAT